MDLDEILELEEKRKGIIISSFICDLQDSSMNLHKKQPKMNFITLGCEDGVKVYPNLTPEQIFKCKKILDIITDDNEYIFKENKNGRWISGKF